MKFPIEIRSIAEHGLPPEEGYTGRVAFIFDGCVVSGWPLGKNADTPWEANSDIGRIGKFGNVTHYIVFPVPIWELEKLEPLMSPEIPSTSVVQNWVYKIPMMQQTVLLCALRGPDSLHKNHPAKIILRWYRRCVLLSATDGVAFPDPWEKGGGSFMKNFSGTDMDDAALAYIACLDEIPHHYQMHFLHAVEILGYKHPSATFRGWWNWVYRTLVHDMHLTIETEEQLDKRLGDNLADLIEVSAIPPNAHPLEKS